MLSDGIDPEILSDFAAETRENLARMEEHLLVWEGSTITPEVFDDMFRAVHNLKGTCGFLGFRLLEGLAHQMESAMGTFRNHSAEANPQMAAMLLRALDTVKTILKKIEAGGTDDFDTAPLIAGIVRAMGKDETAAPGSEAVTATGVETLATAEVPEKKSTDEAEVHPDWLINDTETEIAPIVIETTPIPISEMALLPAPVLKEPPKVPVKPAPPTAEQAAHGPELALVHGDLTDPSAAKNRSTAREGMKISFGSSASHPEFLDEPITTKPETHGGDGETMVRVHPSVLDRVLDLVGQLALSRNTILHVSRQRGNRNDIQQAIQLHRITEELEAEVLKLRQQPLKAAFAPLTRLVRDTALMCGKRVRLEIEGQETETDRVIIDAIRYPLQHLVRNSIDHGIEKPDARTNKGKSQEGIIRLTARYDGGRVVIEVEDDGGGLNVAKIRDKALAQGLVTQEQLSQMTLAQVQQIIFLPGFSTADQVSLISGRGVGLDIVKRSLEKISATVDVTSTPGQGTRFRIVTNRAVMTVGALVLGCGGSRFALTHTELVKLVRLKPEEVAALVSVEGNLVYRHGNTSIPLLQLHDWLKLPTLADDNDFLFAIVGNGHQIFGLIVEEFYDSEDIIVRPLGKYLTGVEHFKGMAILEDGGLALVLNLAPMLRSIDFEAIERKRDLLAEAAVRTSGLDEAMDVEEMVLTFRVAPRGQMAIRLQEVLRMEEINPKSVESEGEVESTQYWGEVLRLIPVQKLLLPNLPRPELWRSEQSIPVIVLERSGSLFGLVVTEILDVTSVRMKLLREDTRKGLFGTLLANGKITELLDGHGLIELFETGSSLELESGEVTT